MPPTYDHPRPALTVDCVVFGLDAESLKVLLIERRGEPFPGCWALPGGFVDEGEAPLDAARRELEEETSLADIYLEQLYTFGRPGRDPRGWVVSIAHLALVNIRDRPLRPASDARQAGWFAVSRLPPLAFDHREIIDVAYQRLVGKVRYQPIGFELLPRAFTLSELQDLYETILARKLDKRNFRRRVLKTGLLNPTQQTRKGQAHRPALLYRFDVKKYRRLSKQGFLFEI
jgi:8-oxo-dGTP diphosphatase